jgi:hypothetical protein
MGVGGEKMQKMVVALGYFQENTSSIAKVKTW